MRALTCHVPVKPQSNVAIYNSFICDLEELDAHVLSASENSEEPADAVKSAATVPPAKKQKVAVAPSVLKKKGKTLVKFEADVFGVATRDALENYIEPGKEDADEEASL